MHTLNIKLKFGRKMNMAEMVMICEHDVKC